MKTIKKSMPLSKAIEGFLLTRRAEGKAPGTITIYQWAFQRMLEFLGDKDIQQISSEDIQRFYLWMQTEYKPTRMNGDTSVLHGSSVEKIWISIRSFYNWASEVLGVERVDTLIKRPRYQSKEISPLTEKEVKALLKSCMYTRPAATNGRRTFSMRRDTGNRDTAIILMLLDTGLRVSELARLKIKDVNVSTGEVFVDAFGTGQKTKSRHVYIGKQTRKALWRYMAEKEDFLEDEPMFATRSGKSMDRTNIRQMLNEAGSRAGVENVHPHRFRHTFAIQFLRNGGDIFTLQRILGHSTLAMVRHYLDLADSDSFDIHRKCSPVDRWTL